ncbi:MAG: hypothetical protein INQ03_19005 [Candidatus Heimdallarchaeota archaeon]|nr:hypothetical protein [Candidatus Heimdallarchaeota archaeon]
MSFSINSLLKFGNNLYYENFSYLDEDNFNDFEINIIDSGDPSFYPERDDLLNHILSTTNSLIEVSNFELVNYEITRYFELDVLIGERTDNPPYKSALLEKIILTERTNYITKILDMTTQNYNLNDTILISPQDQNIIQTNENHSIQIFMQEELSTSISTPDFVTKDLLINNSISMDLHLFNEVKYYIIVPENYFSQFFNIYEKSRQFWQGFNFQLNYNFNYEDYYFLKTELVHDDFIHLRANVANALNDINQNDFIVELIKSETLIQFLGIINDISIINIIMIIQFLPIIFLTFLIINYFNNFNFSKVKKIYTYLETSTLSLNPFLKLQILEVIIIGLIISIIVSTSIFLFEIEINNFRVFSQNFIILLSTSLFILTFGKYLLLRKLKKEDLIQTSTLSSSKFRIPLFSLIIIPIIHAISYLKYHVSLLIISLIILFILIFSFGNIINYFLIYFITFFKNRRLKQFKRPFESFYNIMYLNEMDFNVYKLITSVILLSLVTSLVFSNYQQNMVNHFEYTVGGDLSITYNENIEDELINYLNTSKYVENYIQTYTISFINFYLNEEIPVHILGFDPEYAFEIFNLKENYFESDFKTIENLLENDEIIIQKTILEEFGLSVDENYVISVNDVVLEYNIGATFNNFPSFYFNDFDPNLPEIYIISNLDIISKIINQYNVNPVRKLIVNCNTAEGIENLINEIELVFEDGYSLETKNSYIKWNMKRLINNYLSNTIYLVLLYLNIFLVLSFIIYTMNHFRSNIKLIFIYKSVGTKDRDIIISLNKSLIIVLFFHIVATYIISIPIGCVINNLLNYQLNYQNGGFYLDHSAFYYLFLIFLLFTISYNFVVFKGFRDKVGNYLFVVRANE